MIRGELKAFVAVAFLATALASPVFAAATVNGPRVQLYGCSVSNDPSPPDFSVPAGALPLGLAMADFTGIAIRTWRPWNWTGWTPGARTT